MPIEIRELQIKVAVQQTPPSQQGTSSASSSPAADNEAVVAACVEQVLEILNEKTNADEPWPVTENDACCLYR